MSPLRNYHSILSLWMDQLDGTHVCSGIYLIIHVNRLYIYIYNNNICTDNLWNLKQ